MVSRAKTPLGLEASIYKVCPGEAAQIISDVEFKETDAMAMPVGVDIAKRKFDVAIKLGAKWRDKSFSNDQAGFKALLKWLNAMGEGPWHLCMEATGSYHEALALFLHDAGVKLSVVNPALIAHHAKTDKARNKTDQQDARSIARYCEMYAPEPWQAPSLEERTLRDYVRRLEALHDLQRQERSLSS